LTSREYFEEKPAPLVLWRP